MNRPSPRWALLERFDIPDANDPTVTYLRRWRIVQTPWFGILLHRIYLPDSDRDPHDHPWDFTSIVLRGGYTEHVYWPHATGIGIYKETTWRLLSVHRITRDLAHRITTLQPGTVTLVLTGPRRREWGFWTEDGWVHWRTYVDAKFAPGGDPA